MKGFEGEGEHLMLDVKEEGKTVEGISGERGYGQNDGLANYFGRSFLYCICQR